MSFQLAPGQLNTRVVERPLISGYAELEGAVVKVTSGEYEGVGTDAVAAIAGVMIGPGGTDTSGFNITGHKEFPEHTGQAVWPGPGIVFSCEYVSTIGTIGEKYALIKDTDNKYKVDFSDTGNDAVRYVGALSTGVPESQNRVLVTFLPAVVVDN
jgi:hypothetical protein